MKEPEKTVLWSADSVAPNQSSITLSDSIDNYDEIIFYGSGTRNYVPNVQTNYPVISGKVNLGGPFFYGKWGSGDSWLLCNGTQVYLSGTSGFVASSYFWGKTDGGTAYNASLVNNRVNDVRPYKIVGVKYPKNFDRTLIWSATENEYGKNITLSEPVTHFKEIEVRASGFETAAPGCHHAGKNIYNTQPRLMGCDAWAYSPWKVSDRHNLIIGNEMRVSGNSGFIGSGYYFGMGSNSTAWVAGKWTDWIEQALMPYEVYGLEHKPVRSLTLINGDHGTVSASVLTGCEYDTVTLSNTPDADWYFSGYNITGASLTGNKFTFGNSDVTVEGVWADQPQIKTLTLQTDGHGTLTANKVTGYEGDTVTLTPTYNTYYRFSGYQATGGTINGNTYTFGTAQEQTAQANFKVNVFTASGGFEKGSNVTCNPTTSNVTTSVPAKYATTSYHTSNVPSSYYATSNRWKPPTGLSAYKITLNSKMTFTANIPYTNYCTAACTAVSLIGSTQTQTASTAYTAKGSYTWNYSKSFTSNSLNVNYGLSAKMNCKWNTSNASASQRMTYSAAKTTGTWTATGYIP